MQVATMKPNMLLFFESISLGEGYSQEKKLVIAMENNCANTETPAKRAIALCILQEHIPSLSNRCSNKRPND